MLLKDAVGIEGGLGVDHFLVGDLCLFAPATLRPWLSLSFSGFAISAGRGLQLGNLPSCFQLRSNIANGVMADLGCFSNLPIALSRVDLYQLRQQVPLLFGGQMPTMDVGADDVSSRVN